MNSSNITYLSILNIYNMKGYILKIVQGKKYQKDELFYNHLIMIDTEH